MNKRNETNIQIQNLFHISYAIVCYLSLLGLCDKNLGSRKNLKQHSKKENQCEIIKLPPKERKKELREVRWFIYLWLFGAMAEKIVKAEKLKSHLTINCVQYHNSYDGLGW